MTTVVRQGNMVYTDSCYGSPVGTERTRIYGEPKFFINTNKTFLAAICGSIPPLEVCDFLTTIFPPYLERYLGNYLNDSINSLVSVLETYFNNYRKTLKDNRLHFVIIFFTKNVTVQLSVRINNNQNKVHALSYSNQKDLAFGSGAAWWIAQKDNVERSVAEKFATIYQLDINSGGTINAFDLNNLKDIK